MSRPYSSLLRWPSALALAGALLLGGCYTIKPMMTDDLPAFQQGIDGILKVGMSYKEVRRLLKEKMPQPSLVTEVAPAVPTRNTSMRARRFMIGWPTTTPGTTMVLTLFCDRDMTVVRWTTGPVMDDH